MKKNQIIIISILLIVFFSKYNIFCLNDNTSDKNTSKKNSLLVLFSTKDKISASFYSDDNKLYTLSRYYLNESDLTLYSKRDSLSFLFYLNDKIVISYNKFYEGYYDEDYQNNDKRSGLVFCDAFSNILSTGLENEIDFKNILKLNFINFKFILNMPFDESYSLLFIPYLKFSGDYYTGFNWIFSEFFISELFPDPDYNFVRYTQSSYLYLAYEFFRFYGPKNFRCTIFIDNTLDFMFSFSNSLQYKLNVGFFLNFNNLRPVIYYLMESYCDTYPFKVNNEYVGFNAGIEYEIKWFLLSISYEGKIDCIQDEKYEKKMSWISTIDSFFRFKIIY